MDEAIASVVAVTGSSPELAAQYVQLADGDANQAVQLFFENGGADLANVTASASVATTQPSTSRVTEGNSVRNPIDVDDEEMISDDNDPEITGFRKTPQNQDDYRQTITANVEDDEAMARRLQEEMYGSSEQAIRAPIARQVETLVGPGAENLPMSSAELDASVEAQMRRMQNRRQRPGIFNQTQPTSSIWQGGLADEGQETLSQATGGASEASSRSGMLARLFQPPWDLMYKGSWEDARDEGKQNKKWILVSIQDPSVFDCQALNRDLWKNDGVKDTVQENFIFLQYSKDDPRADSYIQFYFPGHEHSDNYPHVAIVDPRTGEQIKLWSRKIPAVPEFLMQLHEFLDRYSLENNVRNPVAKRRSEAKKEKTYDQMTEEEMMQKALQESMANQSQTLRPPPTEDPDDLTRSVGDLKSKPAPEEADENDAMSLQENGDKTAEASPFALIPADNPHVEPPQGPGITRVQIRHPGGRVVRRFAQDDLVQRIYEYLKSEPLEGKTGAEFELVSMGKNLLDSRQETIESAGLKNGTVMVEFVDG